MEIIVLNQEIPENKSKVIAVYEVMLSGEFKLRLNGVKLVHSGKKDEYIIEFPVRKNNVTGAWQPTVEIMSNSHMKQLKSELLVAYEEYHRSSLPTPPKPEPPAGDDTERPEVDNESYATE